MPVAASRPPFPPSAEEYQALLVELQRYRSAAIVEEENLALFSKENDTLSFYVKALESLIELSTRQFGSLQEAYETYLELGARLLNMETAIVSRIENESYEILAVQAPNPDLAVGLKFDLGDTLCSFVVAESKSLFFPALGSSELRSHPAHEYLQLESYVAAPIIVEGKVVGTLNFSSTTPQQGLFSKPKQDIVQMMALKLANLTTLFEIEEQLTRNELRFRTLAQHAPIGITISPSKRNLSFVNPCFAHIIGYEVEELHELDWVNLTYEEDRKRNMKLYQTLLDGEKDVIEFEKRYHHKAGHLVWCKLIISKVWNQAEEDWMIITMVLDISIQKEQLAALQQGREELAKSQVLLDAGEGLAKSGTWIWHPLSGRLEYTAGLLDLFELEPEVVSEFNLSELIHEKVLPEDRHLIEAAGEKAVRKQVGWEIEYRIRRNNGEIRWIRAIAPKWMATDSLLGVSFDITAEKLAQMILLRSNEELAATNEELRVSQEELLLQQSQIRQASQKIEQQRILLSEGEKVAQMGSWILHPATRYTEYSDGFLAVHGFSKSWVTEENALEFAMKQVHPSDAEIVQETWENLSEQELPFSIEYRFIKPDGKIIWVRDTCGQRLSDGRLLGTTQDITISKKREIELEEVQKELEQLVYSVTHDLRAPVRHIEGYSNLVLEEGPLLDQQKLLLNRVISSADRLGRLIDELLEYARTRSMVLVKKELSLEQIVHEIIGEYDVPGLSWKVSALPIIQGDKDLIHRVWENLIGNAVKFTGETQNPRIEISVEEHLAEWLFAVIDNGSGFDMRFSHKLFNVFQRLHPQDEFPGTGIGLAIVERILRQHGGKIWAKGVVNEGASFYFTIPK